MHNRLLFLAVLMLATACSDSNNSPPEATIEQPSVGTEVLEGSEVSFLGVVEDRSTRPEELEVSWNSSIDGALHDGLADSDGNTTFATAALTAGDHTITLQVRDGMGATGQATVDLLVRADAAPTIAIVAPLAGGVFYSDVPVTLQATADDAEDLPVELLVGWHVDGGDVLATDVVPDSAGLATTSADLAAGSSVLIATATDTAGNTGTATVTIAVGPPNTAPDCAITAPADLSSAPVGQLVLLEGTASDVDVPSDWLTASFTSSIDGDLGEVTPTTAGEIGVAANALTAGTHTITMGVADEVGGTCTDAVLLTISTPPSVASVSITPTTAWTDTTLTAVPSGWSDADGDPESYMYEWFADGTAVGTDSVSLAGGEFVKGETITVTITPQDASSSGTPVTSAGVTVLNTAPTAPGVTISPSAPTDADDLACSVSSPSLDLDGDSITYSYAWLLGSATTSNISSTLPASATIDGETWTCELTPNDGEDDGPVGSTSVGPLDSACGADVVAQGMSFVRLCGGTFDMGCTAGQSSCQSNESPAHSVTLSHDFWMGETEVTQAQWQAQIGNNPSNFTTCGTDCPVDTVNWYEALAFANAVSASEGLTECYSLSGCSNTVGNDMECSSVTVTSGSGLVTDCEGYRLPTEAEWEYAARGGQDLLYSGSNTIGDVAWYSSNSSSQTHPAATLQPNAWGLYDMSGNVWEWTWDWYSSSYYSNSPSTDPEGPNSGSARVRRGGSWFNYASVARVAGRYDSGPGNRNDGLGFRLSRTIP